MSDQTGGTVESWDEYEAACMNECMEIGPCVLMCPPRCQSRIINEDPLPRKIRQVRWTASFVESVRRVTGDQRFPLS